MRVQIDAGSLAYVGDRLECAPVWTAHVDIDAEGDLLGAFWKLIAELAWSDYFDHPRETSFGAEDFDRYPKGTTCFLAPRQLLLDAIAAAVIGGVSLFGGRGSAWSIVLGVLIIGSLENGLTLLNQQTNVKEMIEGLVLLIAVTFDAVLRRLQARSGR